MNHEEMNRSTICAQLWFGATIRPNGTAGICCEISDELPDMNIRTHTLQQMQSHPKIIMMRNEMLNGGKPKECWRCWEKEKHGAPSLRQTLNQHYEGMNGEFDPNRVKAQNIELVLGNLCQLRCVMCHPARSKKVEQAMIHVIKTDFRKSYQGLVAPLDINFNTTWVEDAALWETISEQTRDAQRLFINGGEPMLAKYHERVLERLIEQGTAQDCMLVYSSNGLLIEDRHVELWRHFKEVSIAFSLDDIEDRNHFIRYPTDWTQLRAALDRVVAWQADPRNANIRWGMWCAINVLSFAYMPEYLEFFRDNYPSIHINGWRAIQTPPYMNPSILPQEFKEQVASEIHAVIDSAGKRFDHLRSDVDLIVNSASDATLLDDGMAYMKNTADHHGIDIHATFPKMLPYLPPKPSSI